MLTAHPGAMAAAAAASVSLLVVLLVLTLGPLRRAGALGRRIDLVREQAPARDGGAPASGGPLMAFAAGVGRAFTRTGLLSPKAITDLEHTLASAGMRGGHALAIFVGAKVILVAAMPALAWTLGHNLALGTTWLRIAIAIAGIAGLMMPDMILGSIRKRYVTSVERAIPDALDLLVICAEAGLALEQGMERVAAEIRVSSPACATELSVTHHELRILADRRAALVNMGRRTGLVSLRRLAGTLAQALQYGTPLSQALRALSAELRSEALTRFEGRAARLPVLMTVPMIVLILPCVFLVVAGPAMLAILDTLMNR